jgi:tetratricopeptide (TPR) repeat protein
MITDLRKKLEPVGRLDVLDGVGDRALAYYAQQDLDRLDADSLGRRNRALHLIGDLAQQRGRLDEAERDFRQAADSTAALLRRHPGDGQRIFDHAQSEYWVGYAQYMRGRLTDAEASFRRYLALADRLNAIAPDNLDWQLEHVYAATNVATVLLDSGRAAEALALVEPAERTMTAIARVRPDEAFDLATIIGWVMRAQEGLGRYDDAVESVKRKVAAARRAPNADTDASVQEVLATASSEFARLSLAQGRRDEADGYLRDALAQCDALVARDPSNLDWLYEATLARARLAEAFLDRGDVDGARAIDRRMRADSARLLAAPRPKRDWRIELPSWNGLLQARLARDDAQRAAAAATLRSALADARIAAGGELAAGNINVITRAGIAFGDILQREGRAQEASAAWTAAAARNAPLARRGDAPAMTSQAMLSLRLGRPQEARAWADRVQATSYRHPAFIELEDQLGAARTAGATPAPLQGKP